VSDAPVLSTEQMLARSRRTQRLSAHKAGRTMRAKVAADKIELAIKLRKPRLQ